MPDFYVTFGQKYPREPHPSWGAAHHNGWVRLVGATDRADARGWATVLFGRQWSEVYDSLHGFTALFPLGEIGRVDVTGYDRQDPHGSRPAIEDARTYRGLLPAVPENPYDGPLSGGIGTSADGVEISDAQGRRVYLRWTDARSQARTILDAARWHAATDGPMSW